MEEQKKTLSTWQLLLCCASVNLALWVLLAVYREDWVFALPGLLLSVVTLVALVLGRKRHRQYQLAQQKREEEIDAREAAIAQQLRDGEEQQKKTLAEFRSSLAHGLRMPLSIIRGYTELLAGGMVGDEALKKEYLAKILDRCHYMGEVLNRQFTDEQSMDQVTLHCKEMDLLKMVCQTVSDMRTAAAEKQISMQVVTKENAVPLEADAYLLNQVLFNLLENTLKYMGRPGTCTLLVLQQEDHVVLKIQDDGLGLPAEETAHIFELHYQGSNFTGGQGHGLYLVKKIIEAHGGTVTASSDCGRGMNITITLPVHCSQKQEEIEK